MEFPDPVIEIAIEPKSKADQEKLGVALPSSPPRTRRSASPPTRSRGQTIIKGMGELHLDIKVDILQAHLQGRRQYRRAAGRLPRDAHASRSTIDYTHKKQTGGSGQFAPRQDRRRAAAEPGTGFVFENKIVGGAVPKEYIPGVEKGLESVLDAGLLAGFPVVDLKVDADRRRLPRRRLLGAGLRNRRARGASAKRCRRAAPCCSSRS